MPFRKGAVVDRDRSSHTITGKDAVWSKVIPRVDSLEAKLLAMDERVSKLESLKLSTKESKEK